MNMQPLLACLLLALIDYCAWQMVKAFDDEMQQLSAHEADAHSFILAVSAPSARLGSA